MPLTLEECKRNILEILKLEITAEEKLAKIEEQTKLDEDAIWLDMLDRHYGKDSRYKTREEAKDLLFDHTINQGYFTNYSGCVQYMQETLKHPECKLPRDKDGNRSSVLLSRLAVMAYFK